VTYEGFAAAWPSRDDEAGFAAKMNGMPKYVVSRTLERADWQNSTILSGDPVDEVRRLRGRPGGNILVAGSNTLVHALLAADLVDELRLMVFPTILGAGKQLFPHGPPRSFEVVEAFRAGQTAVVTLHRLEAEAPEAA
jgi:dihydrofolate reductase